MGSLIGHVAPGLGFFIIGLWHLFNHTKLFLLHGRNYRSLPWFPIPGAGLLRRAELYLIMAGMSAAIALELFIDPDRHTPFDPDGTLPSNHLHNVEHASIFLAFFAYAASAISLDALSPQHRRRTSHSILHLAAAAAFSQELLLFHLHSTDHASVEGQYHWLLQLAIAASLATTLLGIPFPRSFVVSYARSLNVLFQGAWLMAIGFMMYIPRLIAKGCFIIEEEGHWVVRCDGEVSLHRAKSLVNIEFGIYLIGLAVFAVAFYLVMVWIYDACKDVEYAELDQQGHDGFEMEDVELETQRISMCGDKTTRFTPFENNTLAVIHHMTSKVDELV